MAEIKQGGEQFSSRWGLIATILGMAVGTGNIWRFPRELAACGGGAFLVIYVIALFTWAVPLICAESVQKTCMANAGAFSPPGRQMDMDGCLGWDGLRHARCLLCRRPWVGNEISFSHSHRIPHHCPNGRDGSDQPGLERFCPYSAKCRSLDVVRRSRPYFCRYYCTGSTGRN